MDDNILNSIKKLLGLASEYKSFDQDIIIHANSVFNILMQLGVGPAFSISTGEEVWSDYLEDISKLHMVKSYMYLKIRLMFDVPNSGPMIEAIKTQIAELEWRLNVQAETKEE